MSLITAESANDQGYQAIPLPRSPGDEAVLIATMVRRSCGRRSRRAVLYVHCLHDPFVQPELAAWYLERGFHFYVADLRAARPRGREATLAEYFGYLDSAARQVRDADGNDTILVSAHQAGAVIAALWCHARRAARSAEALILADPEFGEDQHWLYRILAVRQAAGPRAGPGAASRLPELLPRVQRRVRRGLDISCPVLVMSRPPPDSIVASGAASRAGPPTRLGPHVTWLRLASAVPGLATHDRAIRKRLYDELSRWLGAYLSAEVRDQLL